MSCQDKAKLPQQGTAFENVEEAWFWFIQAQQARNDGARIVAGSEPRGEVIKRYGG